jgi:hypothetical protein
MLKKHKLEENAIFSKSVLWEYQRQYFDAQGIDAWANKVPYFVTSNAYIGAAYAEIILAYLHDCNNQKKINAAEPIYIIELGTGSGRFSFYCLKWLFASPLGKSLNICYIMSDFTEHNLEFWQMQDIFKEYIENGQLDFAIFNLEKDNSIILHHQRKKITPHSLSNPMVVIGNYIFDTVSHDAFYVNNAQLYNTLCTVSTDVEQDYSDKQPIDFTALSVDFSIDNKPIENYYEDVVCNNILKDYQNKLIDTHFLFPIGGIRTLSALASWTSQSVLLLSTDKGHSLTEEFKKGGAPSVTFHGSFSVMVNFHAIGEYCKKIGGDNYELSAHHGTKTHAFLFKDQLKNFAFTKQALHKYLEIFSPSDFLNLHEHIKDTVSNATLPKLISYLRLAHFDPRTFHYLENNIRKLLKDADTLSLASLNATLDQVLLNIYYIPNDFDTYAEIGSCFYEQENYLRALECYQKSVYTISNPAYSWHNMGLCYYFLQNLQEGLICFNKAIALDPTNTDTQEWINILQAAK